MSLFFIILFKISPLYLNVILGYLSARFLDVKRESIATLLIYILGPMVVFSATISVKIDFSIAFIPIFLYIFSSTIAFISLYIWGKSWENPTGNILSFSAGTGNTGYFGIPLATIFFEPQLADIYIFAVLSSLLYESTTGFYVTAKGNFSVRESILKISKLPILYAFILGIIFNIYGFEIPKELSDYSSGFKSSYGILGMMMLGMGLMGLKNSKDNFDLKFITITFIIKFIFWPLSMLLFIYLDKNIFQILNDDLYKVLFLFAIVPLAGNTVTLAVLLNAKPQKASLAVFLSTVVSILFIPLAIYLYGAF